MPDSIGFTFDAKPFNAFLDDRKVRMRRAAMWNVREGGRVLKRAARAAAPVMAKSAGTTTFAQMKRGMKFRKAGGIGPFQGQQIGVGKGKDRTIYGGPVSGLLKGSITPSKRLTPYGPDGFSLKVGPRGMRVHLYAGKAEARKEFMRIGFAAAQVAMPVISQRNYDKVWRIK